MLLEPNETEYQHIAGPPRGTNGLIESAAAVTQPGIRRHGLMIATNPQHVVQSGEIHGWQP